jgi:hypothetical protein
MAEKDGDPEDLELDPPEQGDEDVEQQDQEVVEDQADEQPAEQDEVDGEERQPDRQAGDQQQQPSRRDRRIETLTTSLAEERRLREETNKRLDAILAGQQQSRAPQGETPEARANRLALLDPEARIREELNEAKQGFAREMQVVRFTTQDGNDRAAFQAKATVDPLYKKWEPRVEAELTELRRQGQNVDRERLMYYLIGKNAVEGRQAARPGQRAAAERRVSQQRTRPSNSGSDVQAQRRDRGNSLEKRLENQAL